MGVVTAGYAVASSGGDIFGSLVLGISSQFASEYREALSLLVAFFWCVALKVFESVFRISAIFLCKGHTLLWICRKAALKQVVSDGELSSDYTLGVGSSVGGTGLSSGSSGDPGRKLVWVNPHLAGCARPWLVPSTEKQLWVWKRPHLLALRLKMGGGVSYC